MAAHHIVADRGDAGVRLDQVLTRHLADRRDLSRTRLQALILSGAVRVNAATAMKASTRVAYGDHVDAQLPDAPARLAPAAQPMALDILLEDDDLLAVNKPAGIVVHPSFRHADGTVLNAVLWHLGRRAQVTERDARGGGTPYSQPRLVHRLDKDTSGVLLVSKNDEAHRALTCAMRAGLFRKDYLAVVYGRPRPPRGRITLRLQRDPRDSRRMAASETEGRESVTCYERLAASTGTRHGVSLVGCQLLTGRMHQIRVHLAARGWPIVGDRVYAAAAAIALQEHLPIARQALHAWRLAFPHPADRRLREIVAPLPDDMRRLLDAAGLTS